MEEDEPVSKIILETYQDYREAVNALNLQIVAASQLSDNMAVIAEAIEAYELENNIEPAEEEEVT